MLRFKYLRLKAPSAFVHLESTCTDLCAGHVVQLAALKLAPYKRPVLLSRRRSLAGSALAGAARAHLVDGFDCTGSLPFAGTARRLVRFLDHVARGRFDLERIDLPVLVAEFQRPAKGLTAARQDVVDVLQIYRQLELHDDAALAFRLRGKHEVAHRADDDVRATALVLDAQMHRYRDLPRRMHDLSAQLVELGLPSRVLIDRGQPTVILGRHAGRQIGDVANEDPSYLVRVLSSNFLDDVRELICAALPKQDASRSSHNLHNRLE
jgi:DNA polymerase-3 subunit epsilon